MATQTSWPFSGRIAAKTDRGSATNLNQSSPAFTVEQGEDDKLALRYALGAVGMLARDGQADHRA